MSDEPEDQDEEQVEARPMAADEAFEKSKRGFEFMGVDMKYTPSRSTAANDMGVMFPFIGTERSARWEETGRYAGIHRDVIVPAWLCMLPDYRDGFKRQKRACLRWTPDMAARKPDSALEAAMQWAQEEGIVDEGDSAKFNEAMNVVFEMLQALHAAKFKVQVPGQEENQGQEESPKT